MVDVAAQESICSALRMYCPMVESVDCEITGNKLVFFTVDSRSVRKDVCCITLCNQRPYSVMGVTSTSDRDSSGSIIQYVDHLGVPFPPGVPVLNLFTAGGLYIASTRLSGV